MSECRTEKASARTRLAERFAERRRLPGLIGASVATPRSASTRRTRPTSPSAAQVRGGFFTTDPGLAP